MALASGRSSVGLAWATIASHRFVQRSATTHWCVLCWCCSTRRFRSGHCGSAPSSTPTITVVRRRQGWYRSHWRCPQGASLLLPARRPMGPRPNRLLGIVYGVRAGCLVAAAFAAFRDAPLVVVVPIAATTTFDDLQSADVFGGRPRHRHRTRTADGGQHLDGYSESAAILVGPMLAAELLAVGSPAWVLAASAASAALIAVSALSSMPLVKGSTLQPSSRVTDRRAATRCDERRCLPCGDWPSGPVQSRC